MGSKSTTSTNQGTEPWSGQQGYLADIFARAQGLANGPGPQLWGGDWTANFTDSEKQAQQGLLDYSSGAGGDWARSALDASKFGLTAMDSASNPYLSGYVKAATDPIFQDLNRRTLPQIGSDATLAGAYGGSRQGIAEGVATGDAYRTAGNVGSSIAEDAYGKGLDTYTKTLSMAPSLFQLGAAPSMLQGAVGQQQREMNQTDIDQQRQMYEYQQMLPYLQLQQYLSYVGGNYGSQGTSTTTSPPSLFERIFGSSLF